MNEMFPGFEKMKMLNIIGAANYLGISRQAIYIAISKNKIRANRVNGKYMISERMLDEYDQNKYIRRITLNLKDNEFTPQEVAKKLNITKSEMYYMLRNRVIKSYRINCAYVVKQCHIDEYLKNQALTKTLA
jgi:excisionase family DNA binding protein